MKNILFITTDQQTYDSISGLRSTTELGMSHTPNIDRLVRQGVTFSRHYATNPVCAPARGSWFTGKMPSEHGVWRNELGIDPNVPVISHPLKEAGYQCLFIGKWHLPSANGYTIPGFEVLNPGMNCEGTTSDSLLTRSAVTWIQQEKSPQPFFLHVGYTQPHDICAWLRLTQKQKGVRYPQLQEAFPQNPTNCEIPVGEPEMLENLRFQREGWQNSWGEVEWAQYRYYYYRQVEMVDMEIGILLDSLEASPHANDTIIMFASDHGEGVGCHQLTHKAHLYSDGMRVPLILCDPGSNVSGVVDDGLSSGLDVYPTLCSLAGAQLPERYHGKDLSPVLDGIPRENHDYVVVEAANLILPDHKKPGTRPPPDQWEMLQGRSVITERYGSMFYQRDPKRMLFDYQVDPGETKNIAAQDPQHPELLRHFQLLQEWESKLRRSPQAPQFFDEGEGCIE